MGDLGTATEKKKRVNIQIMSASGCKHNSKWMLMLLHDFWMCKSSKSADIFPFISIISWQYVSRLSTKWFLCLQWAEGVNKCRIRPRKDDLFDFVQRKRNMMLSSALDSRVIFISIQKPWKTYYDSLLLVKIRDLVLRFGFWQTWHLNWPKRLKNSHDIWLLLYSNSSIL